MNKSKLLTLMALGALVFSTSSFAKPFTKNFDVKITANVTENADDFNLSVDDNPAESLVFDFTAKQGETKNIQHTITFNRGDNNAVEIDTVNFANKQTTQVIEDALGKVTLDIQDTQDDYSKVVSCDFTGIKPGNFNKTTSITVVSAN